MNLRWMGIVFVCLLGVCAICVGGDGWILIFVYHVSWKIVLVLVMYMCLMYMVVCYFGLASLSLRCTDLLVVYIFEIQGERGS